MRCLSLALGLAATFAATNAHGGILDDTEKLKGQFIVDVADLESFDCPVSGKYDCLSWPTNFYRFGYDRCMQILGYYGGIGTNKALLAVDERKNMSVFVISGSFSSDIHQYQFVSYKCPSRF